MTYALDLSRVSDWLLSHRNRDCGWGLGPGYPSSIVNTGEALFVLAHAGRLSFCPGSVEYIQSNLVQHREKYGPRLRYTTFAVTGLVACQREDISAFLMPQRDWILAARNRDGGWGHIANDNASHLLPTWLAVDALRQLGVDDKVLEDTYRWILSNFYTDGWRFPAEDQANPVATTYATLVLAPTVYRDRDCVRNAESTLLGTRHWGIYDEGIPGAMWRHCTYPWTIGALIALGQGPFSPVIADGIRYINSLRNEEGGWNEVIGHDTRTVRSQYWAVYAYSAVIKAFDPENDVPRVDADRMTGVLTEPDFVRVLVQTKWASVIPAKAYRLIVYALILTGLLFLFGYEKVFLQFTPRIDAVIAAALLLAAFKLTRKRRRYFKPKAWTAVNIIFGLLVVLNLITGASLADDVESAKGIAITMAKLIFQIALNFLPHRRP